MKKRKTSKDAKLTKGLKTKESKFGLSKGAKSQSKSLGKSVQSEEPEFEVADSDMPQDQEENLGNDDEEPKGKWLQVSTAPVDVSTRMVKHYTASLNLFEGMINSCQFNVKDAITNVNAEPS
ncbi:hypothetical protein Tco_0086233 [Tanacetum coccineum]